MNLYRCQGYINPLIQGRFACLFLARNYALELKKRASNNLTLIAPIFHHVNMKMHISLQLRSRSDADLPYHPT